MTLTDVFLRKKHINCWVLDVLNLLFPPLLIPPEFSVGDYDIEIPENTPSGEYSIRVGRFEDKDMYDCSGSFTIEGSDTDDSEDTSMSYEF